MIDEKRKEPEQDGVYGENKPEEEVRPDDRDTSKPKEKPDPAGEQARPD